LRIVCAVNRTRHVVLAERVAVANSFLRRGWGLLGRSDLSDDEGMLITGTNWIHSFFMRFRFDAIYLDSQNVVCRLLSDFPPFRLGPLVWQAEQVLELPAGTVARTGTMVGDLIAFGASSQSCLATDRPTASAIGVIPELRISSLRRSADDKAAMPMKAFEVAGSRSSHPRPSGPEVNEGDDYVRDEETRSVRGMERMRCRAVSSGATVALMIADADWRSW